MSLSNSFDRTIAFAELLQGRPEGGAGPQLTSAQYQALAQANLGIGSALAQGLAVGVPQAGAVALEYALGPKRVTVLSLTAFSLGNDGNNVSLGIGAKFYSFPAGKIVIQNASMIGAFSTTDVANQAKTLQVGVGSVVAVGAVAVLSGTGTFQDTISGSAPASGSDAATSDTNGGLHESFTYAAQRLIKTAGVHDLFLNAAVAWAAGTPAPVLYTGQIVLEWDFLGA